MVKILITGAKSFIGSNFIRYSQYKEIDEVSLTEFSPDSINYQKYDVVLHLAAIVHQSKKIPESRYFEVNRDLCLRVAGNAKKMGVKQFIFLSTVKVYGKSPGEGIKLNENSPCNPSDAYGRSKLEAEYGLKELEDSSFKVAIIRTPLVYGAGVKANMLRLIQLIELSPFVPFGKIKNRRHYTYVENLVGYIDRVIEMNASGIFIAKDEDAISTTDLVLLLAKYLRKKISLFQLPEFIVKIISSVSPLLYERLFQSQEFDNEITKVKLGYVPIVSTEEGLQRMVMSYLDQKDSFRNTTKQINS
jgi:UDP-glucose 4-epimerase